MDSYADIESRLEQSPEVLRGHCSPDLVSPTLLAPYSIKFRCIKTQNHITSGWYSNNLAHKVKFFDSVNSQKNPVVQIGNFVESASNITILAGGEHHNDHIINNVIHLQKDVLQLLEAHHTKHPSSFLKGPITIGSNVIISYGATILSNVTIGDGAVIGANALVIKDVPPFAIVAGNPARVIRPRFDATTIEELLEIRWWDFNFSTLIKHYPTIQQLTNPNVRKEFKATIDDSFYQPTNQWLVFDTTDIQDDKKVTFAGAEVNGTFIPLEALPPTFRFFMDQLSKPQGSVFYFIKDIFRYSGLTK